MMLLITFILIFYSFICLSLSLFRHYTQVTNNRIRLTKTAVRSLTFLGYSILLISFVVAVNAWGAVLGSVYWFAVVSVDAFILSMILSLKAQWLCYVFPIKQFST